MITRNKENILPVMMDVISQLSPKISRKLFSKEDISAIQKQTKEDLDFYVKSDPAAKGSHKLVINSYSTFRAVVAYRIAHHILEKATEQGNEDYYAYSRLISEWAKGFSGVEIHPGARILSPFVIDHGYGVVIGETSQIGRYCYLLNGVVLGAKSIANNPTAKRHPTLGNYVQIGAFAEILGDITIGSNTIIGPRIKVTTSIPENSRLIRITEYGILRIAEQTFFTL